MTLREGDWIYQTNSRLLGRIVRTDEECKIRYVMPKPPAHLEAEEMTLSQLNEPYIVLTSDDVVLFVKSYEILKEELDCDKLYPSKTGDYGDFVEFCKRS